jgi:hypothetical protein
MATSPPKYLANSNETPSGALDALLSDYEDFVCDADSEEALDDEDGEGERDEERDNQPPPCMYSHVFPCFAWEFAQLMI